MTISISRSSRLAFTLVEVAITTALLGIIFVTFYSGIAGGFSLINLARENLRGNQILLEKMETIRLYTWDQINSNGFIPPTFTAPFYPLLPGETNMSSGITYYGAVTVTDAPLPVNYTNSLKLVTVSIAWTNAHNTRVRTMETLVSEFGMQNYVY